jgi:hypothetical protein
MLLLERREKAFEKSKGFLVITLFGHLAQFLKDGMDVFLAAIFIF